MADPQSPPVPSPVSILPQKRGLEEDDHSPAVSSPLNPNAPPPPDNSMPRKTPAGRPAGREQREKRDSLKKREASGATGRSGTPDSQAATPSKRSSKSALSDSIPLRYQINPPKPSDYEPVRDLPFASREPEPLFTPDGKIELKRPLDHVENKKHYRYTYAVADQQFRHKQYFRGSEGRPFGSRMSFEDADKSFWFNEEAKILCNEKGWRMARANVVAREGRMYYEVKILKGVPPQGPPVPPGSSGPLPHIRMGWARREASLDAPVGFDGYSYGITDIRFESMHRSRAGKFFHPPPKDPETGKPKPKVKPIMVELSEEESNVREGDVIGLEISLPSLQLHQKIVKDTYDPSLDTTPGFEGNDIASPVPAFDVVRDRIPVPYKGNIYFEQAEYVGSKHMETYNDRSLPLTTSTVPKSAATNPSDPHVPHPQHIHPSMRSLPYSSIRVFRNGKLIGTAFENLLAFLPPASKSFCISGQEERTVFDDGLVGYYPAVSSFSGGVAEINLGPDFWYPPVGSGFTQKASDEPEPPAEDPNGGSVAPQDLEMGGTTDEAPSPPLRAMSERFNEQIAEDIVWDVVDEACFFVEDGGYGTAPSQVDGANDGVMAAPAIGSASGLNGDTE